MSTRASRPGRRAWAQLHPNDEGWGTVVPQREVSPQGGRAIAQVQDRGLFSASACADVKWRPHSRQRQRLRGHGAVGRRGPPGHLLTLFPHGRTRGDKAEPKTRGVDSSPSRLGGPSKFLYALGKDSACQKCVCFETSVTFGKEFAQLSPEESGSRAPRALDPGRTTWVTVKWTPGMEPPPRGTP